MKVISDTFGWLTTADHWWGSDGIAHRLAQHAQYSIEALVLACIIALPIGLTIGHSRRFAFLALNGAGIARALPTFGLLVLVFRIEPLALWPVLLVLVVLAAPSILANTYAGIVSVDPDVVDAARGMGMTARQTLWRVEIPLALPLILTGIRSAATQLIATATIAAYVALGGLGRFIVDGLSVRGYYVVVGGAVLVATLALISEGLFALAIIFARRALGATLSPRG